MTFTDLEIKLLGAIIDVLSAVAVVGIAAWANKQHTTNKAIKNADLRAAADHATDSLQKLADNIVAGEAALVKDEAGNIVAGKLADVKAKALDLAKSQVQDALAKEIPWAQNVATSQIESAVSGAVAKIAGTHPDAVQAKVAAAVSPPSQPPAASVPPASA